MAKSKKKNPIKNVDGALDAIKNLNIFFEDFAQVGYTIDGDFHDDCCNSVFTEHQANMAGEAAMQCDEILSFLDETHRAIWAAKFSRHFSTLKRLEQKLKSNSKK